MRRLGPPPAAGEPSGLLSDAAGRATLRIPVADPEARVDAVRDGLAGRTYECADDVAVLDGERLVGLVPIERLLAAPRRARVRESIDPLARLGGYLHRSRQARTAAEEPVARRLPAAVAAARTPRRPRLRRRDRGVRAAARVAAPARGLHPGRRLHGRRRGDPDGDPAHPRALGGGGAEGRRGPRAAHRRGHWRDPGAGLPSRRGDSSGATPASRSRPPSRCWRAAPSPPPSALALPAAFQRLDIDPAFGPGPLATVIQGLLSIVAYFAIATPIAT